MTRSTSTLALLLAVLAGCASAPRVSTTRVTSAEAVASMRDADAAAEQITGGRYADALVLAESAIARDPSDAWARYDRAVALHHLGRADAAVVGYREAEDGFRRARDPGGRAVSVYGRARTLADVGRCDEARAAYAEYGALVRGSDRSAADLADAYGRACRAPDRPLDDPAMNRVGVSLVARAYDAALADADRAGAAAKASGWLDYDRAVALAGLSRTDEAIAAYDAAYAKFGAADVRAKAVAIYGRARALDLAGRCEEARRAYTTFADLVLTTAPGDAAMALDVAKACRPAR